jgi:hypothetical protein
MIPMSRRFPAVVPDSANDLVSLIASQRLGCLGRLGGAGCRM